MMDTTSELSARPAQARADAHASTYTVSRYASISEVDPVVWRAACGPARALFLDPRFIRIVEHAFADQARFEHLLLRDTAGTPVACATLCVYRVDATTLGGDALKRTVEAVRRVWSGFGHALVGMCGLPVSLGESSLGLTAGCDTRQAVRAIERCLAAFCRREGAKVLLFKEFDEAGMAHVASLCARGYRQVESPCMHVLDGRFASFEAYCGALRSHYRNDIRRSARKFAQAGLRIERLRGVQVTQAYDAAFHDLYRAVVAGAENKLETLTLDFFRGLPREFGEDVSLTIVKDRDAVVAFNYSLSFARAYYFLFCGMDYERIRQGDVYFSMMYKDLDHGLREGANVVRLGQASESFKARVGCQPIRLFFLVKGRGVWGLLLRALGSWLFPPRPAPTTYKVFKQGSGGDA